MWQEVIIMLKLVLLVIGGPIVVESQNIQRVGVADINHVAAEDVSSLVRQIVFSYMSNCNVILIRNGNDSLIFNSILSSLRSAYVAEMLIEVDSLEEGHVMKDLQRGHDKLTCSAILLDVTSSAEPFALRFLERMQLFLIPNAYVVFLGSPLSVEDTLMNHALRNTVNTIFLAIVTEKEALGQSTAGDLDQYERLQLNSSTTDAISKGLTSVTIYSRCLYCKEGGVGIEKITKWNSQMGYFKRSYLFDQLHNFMGHQFSVVTMDWYPMIDFLRDSEEVSTTVTTQDSVDVRMLNAIADALNFTYEMRAPWDNYWGTSTNTGNWTGTVGTLQHHKADFSMILSWTWGRYQVVDFSTIYAYETIVMITSKPRPLPPYLALIRPLEGSLWAAVFISSVCAGFILWALQSGWRITSGVRGLSLDKSVLYTWSMLFEEPPKTIPSNVSSQMFLGWWWLYCTLITVVYKSSLIAHLSIPAMSRPIDSFAQLLETDGWTWGYEPIYGSGWEWFKGNENPTIKNIFEGMEVREYGEQMVRVLEGQHALISWKFRIASVIAEHYTDSLGYTPVYTAKTEYFNYGVGWGFRKNCPLKRSLAMAKQRLIETGFVNQWMNELMGTAPERTRNEEKRKGANDKDDEAGVQILDQDPNGLLVLGVHHLQSVFYILFLGYFGALSAFLGEYWICGLDKKSLQQNLPV